MGKDISTKQDLLKAETDLLWAADSGKLDSLDCPSCHRQTVSVWFTHPKPDIYREWFVCTSCSFSFRALIGGIPKHYFESRINQKLQETMLISWQNANDTSPRPNASAFSVDAI